MGTAAVLKLYLDPVILFCVCEKDQIRIGSWNVGSLTGKLRDLVDVAIRRRV